MESIYDWMQEVVPQWSGYLDLAILEDVMEREAGNEDKRQVRQLLYVMMENCICHCHEWEDHTTFLLEIMP